MLFVLSLLSLISTTITFNPTDTEFTAPGVVVEDIACIDLLAYGDPLNIPSRPNDTNIGCQVFFIEKEDGIKWRVNILYRDKLVMLEQDREPLEYYIGYSDCRYAVFSPNGRFVLVGAEVGTEDFPEIVYRLVDLEEETDILFPRTFEISLEAVFWVANDGKVAMLPHARRMRRAEFLQRRAGSFSTIWMPYEIETAPDTLYFYDSNFNLQGQFVTAVGSPKVRCSDDGNTFVLLYEDEIICLDSDGTERWNARNPGSGSRLLSHQISAIGTLYVASFDNGVWWINTQVGENLFAITNYSKSYTQAISREGNSLACLFMPKSTLENEENCQNLITTCLDDRDIVEKSLFLDTRFDDFYHSILEMLSDGSVFLHNTVSRFTRSYYLIDSNDVLIWSSTAGYLCYPGNAGNTNASYIDSDEPEAAFSLGGNKYFVAFISNGSLVIKRINSGELGGI